MPKSIETQVEELYTNIVMMRASGYNDEDQKTKLRIRQALQERDRIAEERGIAKGREEERGVLLSDKRARIAEYPNEGVMFVLKYEDGQLYEASMPIPKWHKTGNVELRDKALTPPLEDPD